MVARTSTWAGSPEALEFFGHFKTDVRGTHHSISRRWLDSYLNEWVWKWNHRGDDEAMFRQLLRRSVNHATG
jgi:hypothetical protein